MMWSQFFHLKNTIWALILPNYLITAFNIMLVKNYYQNSIPDALIEAAEIDGASELTNLLEDRLSIIYARDRYDQSFYSAEILE